MWGRWGYPQLRTKSPIVIRINCWRSAIVHVVITLIMGAWGDRGGLSAVADDVDLRGRGGIAVVSAASSSSLMGRMD